MSTGFQMNSQNLLDNSIYEPIETLTVFFSGLACNYLWEYIATYYMKLCFLIIQKIFRKNFCCEYPIPDTTNSEVKNAEIYSLAVFILPS